MNKNYICVPQMVKVRKHNINKLEFVGCLRKHKNTTNKDIAIKLGVPVSMVEHWFRTDKYFDIVSPEYWFGLKNILGGAKIWINMMFQL